MVASDPRSTVKFVVVKGRSVVALAAAMLLAGCASPSAVEPSIASRPADLPGMAGMAGMPGTQTSMLAPSRLVPPAAFEQAMAEPNRVTIDVHIPFEGKIAGTDLIIPYNEITQHAADLPVDRSTPLAIYCRSGSMSAIAAPELKAMGYTDIVELDGGMDGWRTSGRTLLATP